MDLVKPKYLEVTQKEFSNTKLNITTEGQQYLRATIGNAQFCKTFREKKIAIWNMTLNNLLRLVKQSVKQLMQYFLMNCAKNEHINTQK